LPGTEHKAMNQNITPVNTFRVIFNTYFGTHFEYLDDKSFIPGNYEEGIKGKRKQIDYFNLIPRIYFR
jgi:hypothetical protein